MSWTAGADVVTGQLITSAMWNNYMGVSGSIQYLYDAWVWLGTSVEVLDDNGRTVTLDWTDLDLTASTSATARLVVLELVMQTKIADSGYCTLAVRKNGDTPTYYPTMSIDDIRDERVKQAIVICGCDTGQVIEYRIAITGTSEIDSNIRVLGYMN